MVLVAEESEVDASGLARLVFDPDFLSEECFIAVRSDTQAGGPGRFLLDDALTYARVRGARRIWGDVLMKPPRRRKSEMGFPGSPERSRRLFPELPDKPRPQLSSCIM
jgi:acetyltransferase